MHQVAHTSVIFFAEEGVYLHAAITGLITQQVKGNMPSVVHSTAGIPMSAQYCLNDKEESNIVINLLPLVAKEIMEPKLSTSEAFDR